MSRIPNTERRSEIILKASGRPGCDISSQRLQKKVGTSLHLMHHIAKVLKNEGKYFNKKIDTIIGQYLPKG